MIQDTPMDIEYRPAEDGDLELLMAWRSNPMVYEGHYLQDEPLAWEDHLEWWHSREDRRDWVITVKTDDRWRDVGVVAIAELDTDYPEVSIWVGEVTLWGNGVATEAVTFATEWLEDHDYPGASCRIMDDNAGSRRVFDAVGFERVGDAREGESWYELDFEGD